MEASSETIWSILWSALWIPCVWLSVGMMAAVLLNRHPARAHGALLMCIVAAALTPLLAVGFRMAGWGLLPGTSSSVGLADLTAKLSGEDGASVPTASLGLAHGLAAAWLALSALAAARLMISAYRGRALLAQATPAADGPVAAMALQAARSMGVTAPPQLLESSTIRCPVVWCWGGRPRLILPAGGARGCRRQLQGVLFHELAHFARRDHLASLAGELAVCLLPWNPLAWLANRRLRDLSEHACDGWAMASGEPPTRYAEALLSLAPQAPMALTPAAGNGRRAVARRIRRILYARPQDPRSGARFTVAAGACALLLMAAAALGQRRPATIQVVTDTGETAPLHGPDVITIPSILDLGVGPAAQPAAREVLLCNRSTRTHAVFGAETSCGCTTVSEFEPQTLSPGECMKLEVTMTAPAEPGTRKTKFVTFDVEGQPPLKLAVHLQAAGS